MCNHSRRQKGDRHVGRLLSKLRPSPFPYWTQQSLTFVIIEPQVGITAVQGRKRSFDDDSLILAIVVVPSTGFVVPVGRLSLQPCEDVSDESPVS